MVLAISQSLAWMVERVQTLQPVMKRTESHPLDLRPIKDRLQQLFVQKQNGQSSPHPPHLLLLFFLLQLTL